MHRPHNFYMAVILVGAILLLIMGVVVLFRGNTLASANMFIMGAVAGANYLLHRLWMKRI